MQDYVEWLKALLRRPRKAREITGVVMALYGLVTRFLDRLENLADEDWNLGRASLPEEMDDEEREAVKTGLRKGIRQRMLGELETHTRNFAIRDEEPHNPSLLNRMSSAIEELEHSVRLLEVRLNEGAALEKFLLASLRIWSLPD